MSSAPEAWKNTFASEIMFSRYTALLFLLIFSLQSFSRNLMVMDYHTHLTTYIEKCINKRRPSLQCEGKCQLMQKMQEEEKKEKGNTANEKGFLEILSSRSFFEIHIVPREITVEYSFTFSDKLPFNEPGNVFHPPAL
jgi:hypothetical protein